MTVAEAASSRKGFQALPHDRLRRLAGWGMMDSSLGYVYEVRSADEMAETLALAAETGRSVMSRGSGYSYGDAALNAENIVLETRTMNRILQWNPQQGVLTSEPGVTIHDLWRHVIGDGWWPPVVPGAMHPSLGGCVSANIHGKNNWRVGTIADHLLSAELMLPSGEILTISPGQHPELFYAVVGGMGLLGVLLKVTLQMERIHSALLDVELHAPGGLDAMFELFEANVDSSDYAVGWIDGFTRGTAMGRGLAQFAKYRPEEDVADRLSLQPDAQDLGEKVAGVVPRTMLWPAMKPMAYDEGMRVLNAGRFRLGQVRTGRRTRMPIAKFEFLHDYVPDWKRALRPGGILQYQVFVPTQTAPDVFARLLEASQNQRFYPRLIVFKRHREDTRSLLSYNVDGYSLSVDYHATKSNLPRLKSMLSALTDEVVLPAAGRFYLAKDSVLTADQARQAFGSEPYGRFLALKDQYDPEHVLQSDLYRRVFTR